MAVQAWQSHVLVKRRRALCVYVSLSAVFFLLFPCSLYAFPRDLDSKLCRLSGEISQKWSRGRFDVFTNR